MPIRFNLPSSGQIGTQDPFTKGCCTKVKVNEVDVQFRQMCGLQTNCRPKPENPEQILKQVLYYDGIIYNGWQQKQKENTMSKKNKPMTNDELMVLLQKVKNGEVSPVDAAIRIRLDQEMHSIIVVQAPANNNDGVGCTY